MSKKRTPDPERLAEFLAIQKRLERERAAAATLDNLLHTTPTRRWPVLAERPDLQTCGTLERLGKLVADEVGRDPQRAQAIAELAVSLAEAIPAHAYPPMMTAHVRAHAYKDLSTTRRLLGHNQESLDILTRAEEQLGDFGALEHDRAIIRFSRAVTLQELHRYSESMTLLVACREVFRVHKDERRVMLCGLAEGILLQRLGKFRESRETYLLLLAGTNMTDEDRAALHKAIGLCSIELSHFADAEANLTRAIALFRELGQPMEGLKAQAGLGRLAIRKGDVEHGIAYLRPIRRLFLQNSLTEEAGICALEIIEGMLKLRKAAEAEQLARLVIHEFTSAGLNARAISALGYLTEALAARNATPALAGNVREYILSLRTEPEREFRGR